MLQEVEAKLSRTKVAIREVGMREVIQSDPTVLPVEQKVEIFRYLREANLKEINVCSFASSKKMPNMADAESFLRALGPLREGIKLTGLVFNENGMSRAIALKEEGLLDGVLLLWGVTPGSFEANGITPDREERKREIERSAARADDHGLEVTVFQSGTFGSRLHGRIDPKIVYENVRQFSQMRGVTEILISDSQGVADPVQVMRFFEGLAEIVPVDRRLAFHVHDTRGAGLANIFAALLSPFENFVLDSSFGGLGGDYPLVPDSFGNVATEDLAEMLSGLGYDHGVDSEKIVELTRRYQEISGRAPVSKMPYCSGGLAWKKTPAAA